MDLQTVQIFIYAMFTIVLVVIGLYIILVLKEFKETIKKTNSILNNVENVTNVISNPISLITSVISGIRAIKNLKEK